MGTEVDPWTPVEAPSKASHVSKRVDRIVMGLVAILFAYFLLFMKILRDDAFEVGYPPVHALLSCRTEKCINSLVRDEGCRDYLKERLTMGGPVRKVKVISFGTQYFGMPFNLVVEATRSSQTDRVFFHGSYSYIDFCLQYEQ